MSKGDKKTKKGKIWRKSYGKKRQKKNKNLTSNIGILAFGSLINEPGSELSKFITMRRKNVLTPFKIEYGRKSITRGNAPTLIPVSDGGVKVKATLLILSNDLAISEAKNMLYRRELNEIGSAKTYKEREFSKPNQLVIKEHKGIRNVKLVLSASFGSNLPKINAQILADLAIESYNSENVDKGRDGISYLFNNIQNRIVTPLTENYKNAILQKMKVDSLSELL